MSGNLRTSRYKDKGQTRSFKHNSFLSCAWCFAYVEYPCHGQGAAARLKQGAELLTKRLEQDDGYFSTAAELQKHWKLKVSLRRAIHLPGTLYARDSGGTLDP